MDLMNMLLSAVFMKVPEGFIGFVEELPGANTQGATLEEEREPQRGRRTRARSEPRTIEVPQP